MARALVVVVFAAALAACGFHPRAQLILPESLGPVKVEAADPYSELGLALTGALARADAIAAVEGSPTAVLKITDEAWSTLPLSIDQFAQVREQRTTHRVRGALHSAAGTAAIEPQWVELSRDYTYDANVSAGSPAEQELIQQELRRDMQAAILRRLDLLLRARF
jgi:LPS-assembly lipoprotein